jgi:mannosyltransferase
VKRHISCFLLFAILLLAAALRFYRLDAQSFWNDEGNSARIAERTVGLILEGAAGDIHPPGYYLLLHAWRALFGQSEFALRSLSVVAGVVLVVFTYLLGRHLFGEATGLMAAFLGTLSPFAVFYSQEARMYALLAALSAASTYLLVRLLTPNQQTGKPANRRWIVAYVLSSVAGLYTQYAFIFILLVHNAAFGLWWLTSARRSVHRWRWLAVWGGMQVAVVVLYLPWLPTVLRSVANWPSARQAYELGPALLDVLRILNVGITLPLEQATIMLAGAVVLLIVGLWPRREERMGWFGVASAALYLLLPVALVFAFDLYKEAWLKFLLVVAAPFNVLVAHGVDNIAHVVPGDWRAIGKDRLSNLRFPISFTAIAFIITATFPSLHNLYFDPAYFRDDYRQIAADIAAAARPTDAARPADAIILNAPNQWEVFTYYYPDQDVYPAHYRPSPHGVEVFMAPLAEQYSRLFVLYWGDAESDPNRRIERWLAANTYKASDRWYGRVRLATYGVAPLPEEPAVSLDARFGEAIRLRGYALDDAAFAPGDILPVTLFWEAETPATERYKVTVQLLDGAGQLVAQHDTEPGGGLMPTDTWQPGQAVTDRCGILLPADLSPGSYTLVVALYHSTGGERLPVTLDGDPVSDHLVLSDIEVTSIR